MKKILTRILKRACKRFNIEREDLFDAPDSSARSKSSPREPVAEGDENVEWLALDATKRCTEKKRTRMSGEGVATRSRKRKIAQRDSLWDLIVNNDDICFTHILPRLDLNDVKFLYEVNTETRKLVKRSSRAGDLKKIFKVEEMSSISTLEVAWEHFPWGTYNSVKGKMDETYFCREVAYTNKLELLKWAREEKKCEWNDRTIWAAARQGNLEMVKYCVANECPINVFACAYAAESGILECLKYLHEEVKAPWDDCTASSAAFNGHLHILEYLVEREYDEYDEDACEFAAGEGHVDCLKYLHETAKAPWDYRAVRYAHENEHPECVQYLLDNNCPLPFGWRYEHGELKRSS
jgi:hypothetical protein